MKREHNMVRLVIVVTMLVVAMSMMAQPGVAADGIDSATLYIYVRSASGATVNVHRVTAPWTETGVTWNNFGGDFDPEIVDSFVADGVGWRSADVTALVQAWYSGGNYGLLIEQGKSEGTIYESSESDPVDVRPKLEICFSGTGCVIIQRGTWGNVADAYIWELMPDFNGGGGSLYTGLVLGVEKQSLLQFELPPPPPPPGQGCTPGGWQGGHLSWRWDQASDPNWNPPGGNPYDHETLFNAYFAPVDSLAGLTMIDLVGTGGKKDHARKAARSLVAAYLNASHDDVDYPATVGELEDKWADAVGSGEFLELHKTLDEWNNLGCSIE